MVTLGIILPGLLKAGFCTHRKTEHIHILDAIMNRAAPTTTKSVIHSSHCVLCGIMKKKKKNLGLLLKTESSTLMEY